MAKAFQNFVSVASERVLALDLEVARRWAVLRAKWQYQGQSLPVLDSMIEATALHWGLWKYQMPVRGLRLK